ncbi:MAG: M1 family metallopeptidase [Saprospiraceae bacterium]
MNKPILIFLFTILTTLVFSQKNKQPYFQQEVNYDIQVTLDDKNHILSGVTKIEYINNSPDDLKEIYFHLWANAYQNQRTAFAKQQIQNGSTAFFFAKKNELGGYQEVDFLVNEKKVNWSYDEDNPDIALLQLNEKLSSGGRIEIRIPFKIKIPKYFSRLGHEKQAYYISQWYPKPAVYDRVGWHPMPYLDMGEFYAEFGKFEVKITLPKNYIVASTGQLQTETEKAFLEKRVRETNKAIAKFYPRGTDRTLPIFEKDTFPKSSDEMKTIHFTAENVHDFAWFADKRFFVQKGRVQVGRNNNVDTWAFFNLKEFHLWLNATQYLDRSVQFYSQKIGAYPYPHATAVSNPYANAGAMEYPMITLVDRMVLPEDLDVVIAHEVGHNWFYGILAFNERDFPWMDEGINSYYERLYKENFYPNFDESILPEKMKAKGQLNLMELIKVSMQRENVHQAITTPVSEMTEMNYGLGVYDRTADILKNRIPPLKMKSFFRQWKFKHPQPEDFIKHFDLENDQAFDDLMNTTKKIDYKAVSLSESNGYDLKIENKGEISEAFELTMVLEEGEEVKKIAGFEGEKTIHIDAPENGVVKEFIIDKDREILDVNRRNNNIRTSGIFKKSEPFKLKFLAGIENPTRTSLYWLPAIGWNNYDKTMLGAVLHNYDFSKKNFEFAVAPMYGFASGNIVGEGIVKWNAFPESDLFQRITLSLNSKRYTYDYDWDEAFYDNYLKIAPKLELVFRKKKLTSSLQHSISLRHVNITLDKGVSNAEMNSREKENYYVNEFKYTFENTNVTGPMKATLTAHQGDGFLRIFANAKQFFSYGKKNKGMTLKAFAGVLPQLDNNVPIRASFTFSGITSRFGQRDYMFDENLLGRSEGRGNVEGSDDGILSQQIFHRDAGLKTLSDFGSSQDWMVSLGASTTVPGPLPVRPYVDAVLFKDFDSTEFAYSLGIAIVGIPDALEIYVPIYESSLVTEGTSYEVRDNLLKRISFLIDLNNLKMKGKEMVKFY